MIIVGLGNPGTQYKDTLHNMGYLVIEELAKKLGKKIAKIECSALTAVLEINGEKVVLAKPTTYMNLSGVAVKSLMSKYGAKPSDIIVVYDDIDLPRYTVRVRGNGSAGTHNGMRNIVQEIGTLDFIRVRVGIGRNEFDLKDYVLSKVNKEDKEKFTQVAAEAAEVILQYLRDKNFDKLMREGNVIK